MSFVLHVAAVRPVTTTEVEAETPVEKKRKMEERLEDRKKIGRQKEDWKIEGRLEDRRKIGRQKEDWKTEGRLKDRRKIGRKKRRQNRDE